MSESTIFFLGSVILKSGNMATTTFEVVGSDAVITVRNDIHLRFNKSLFSTKPFQILAPMTAVEVINGSIPQSFLSEFELQNYIQLRDDRVLRKKFAKELLR